eukprot:TRINITY_DN14416_c0_g1_i1.p1 TRINITY_DN14416_c0_g1~~TRINITY_DN14416_c0_g1_i1.p1  ORF type:complete len:478 (+),score=125.70 TRINITY_DN14416_c0_g1_i1:58-1491(+)
MAEGAADKAVQKKKKTCGKKKAQRSSPTAAVAPSAACETAGKERLKKKKKLPRKSEAADDLREESKESGKRKENSLVSDKGSAEGTTRKTGKKKLKKNSPPTRLDKGSAEGADRKTGKKKQEKKSSPRSDKTNNPENVKKAPISEEEEEEQEAAALSDSDSFFGGDEESGAGDVVERVPSSAAGAASTPWESRVFVGNVPASLDETAVKQKFESFGNIVQIDMPTPKEGSCRRHAFVHFQNETAAQSALKLDGCDFHGLQLQVKLAASRKDDRQQKDALTVFITGLGADMDAGTLKKDFAECGSVETVRMLRNADGSFKGTAFIVFESAAAVTKALEWNGEYYGANRVIIRRTGKESEKGKGKSKDKGHGKDKGKKTGTGNWNSDHDRTVFLGSVYPQATEAQLREDFGECGELESVRMVKDKDTGYFKGAAFVVFKTQSGAKRALEWNGHDYYGRTLTVSLAQAKGSGKGKTGKGK